VEMWILGVIAIIIIIPTIFLVLYYLIQHKLPEEYRPIVYGIILLSLAVLLSYGYFTGGRSDYVIVGTDIDYIVLAFTIFYIWGIAYFVNFFRD